MSGVTTRFGFPYPTGSDRVQDGDNAIQALAQALDNFLIGPAWITVGTAGAPAFQNGWSNIGGLTQPAQFRKLGDAVHLRMSIKGANGIGGAAFQLPVGYRPLYITWLPCYAQNIPGIVQISLDGSVAVGPGSAGEVDLFTTFYTT